jgi:hypothetical protein
MLPRQRSAFQIQSLAERAIQGTLVELLLRCGTPSCGCHQDPSRRHGPHLYLKFRDENGRSTSLYIPRVSEREIRAAVQAWSRLWETIVRLSHRNRHGFKQRLRRKRRG